MKFKAILCFFLTGLVGLSGFAQKSPNIIYILADDLGYGDLSCYGQQKFDTPNLDQMAQQGMKFTQHYAGSAVCAPSRCSLLTGMDQGHADIRGNKGVGKGYEKGNYPMNSETVTIAEVLKKKSYQTAAIGKWGLGSANSKSNPNDQGFDFFYGYIDQGNAHHYYPEYLWRNKEVEVLEENKGGKRGVFTHDLFTKEALQFIKAKKEDPFFLYLAYTIPHADLDVPGNDLGTFSGKFKEVPYKGGGYIKQPEPRAAFAGMITRMDRDIGRINQLLKELGIDENTLVIFSSDNGPHKAGGGSPEFFDSNGPLRGIKRDGYEGGIRVPMIAKWPGKIKSNTTSDHISAFWDVLPTFAEVAEVSAPKGINGVSFLPTLTGVGKQKKPRYLYWEFHQKRKGHWQAVRIGKWKAVKLISKGGKEKSFELFDLDSDLGETKNLTESFPKMVKKMRKIMTKRTAASLKEWNF